MNDILKGNFKPQKEVSSSEENDSLESQFEKEARKRLGGSIAFVSKQKVIWDFEEEKKISKNDKDDE